MCLSCALHPFSFHLFTRWFSLYLLVNEQRFERDTRVPKGTGMILASYYTCEQPITNAFCDIYYLSVPPQLPTNRLPPAALSRKATTTSYVAFDNFGDYCGDDGTGYTSYPPAAVSFIILLSSLASYS